MSKYRGGKSKIKWDVKIRPAMQEMADRISVLAIELMRKAVDSGRNADGRSARALSASYKKRLKAAGLDVRKDLELTGGLKASIHELKRKSTSLDVVVITIGPDDKPSIRVNLSSKGSIIAGTGEPYSAVAEHLAARGRKIVGLSRPALKKLAKEIESRLKFKKVKPGGRISK